MMIIDLSTLEQNLRKREFRASKIEIRCRGAALDFDYSVSFSGVGTPKNAIAGFPQILDRFPHLLNIGYCTQTAVFTRAASRAITPMSPSFGPLEVLWNHQYPANMITAYPPDSTTIATSLGDIWRQFRPVYSRSEGFSASSLSRVLNGKLIQTKEELICRIPVEKLYDVNYNIQKLCHFNKDVFLQVGHTLGGQTFDRGKS
jgi:hypothetical protein